MAQKIYPKGIVTFAPGEKAPEFVVGTVIINIDEFIEWTNGEGSEHTTQYNGKDQIRLSVLTGKNRSRPTVCVDTYKPKPKEDE